MKALVYNIWATTILRISVFAVVSLSGASVFPFKVCIDPGHGGYQLGCPTHIPDYHEKHINLEVAQYWSSPKKMDT